MVAVSYSWTTPGSSLGRDPVVSLSVTITGQDRAGDAVVRRSACRCARPTAARCRPIRTTPTGPRRPGTALHIVVVDAQRFPDRAPGGGIPPPHRLVRAARADAAAVVEEPGPGHVVVAEHGLPTAVSHSRTVPSSPPDDTRCRPSGLNATAVTAASCPRRDADLAATVAASHNRMVLSALPVAMRVPSGLNATLFTASSWR